MAEQNVVQTALANARDPEAKSAPTGYLDGKPYIVLRDATGNERLEFLGERFEAPARMTGTVKLDDVGSFLTHWHDHATAYSRIYALLKDDRAAFVAVYDEHAGPVHGDLVTGPDFRGYRALFVPQFSLEWELWKKGDNVQRDNLAFAEWLEDVYQDIVDPAGSHMLQVALNFKVVESGVFDKVSRLEDGSIDFTYRKAIEGSANVAGNRVSIPAQFTIQIPVFKGFNEPKRDVRARFRYRVAQGRAVVWYSLERPARVLQEAYRALWARIAQNVNVEGEPPRLLLGTPE